MAEANGKLDLAIGTLAEILAANDTSPEGVVEPMPEWGCSVRLRGLTRGEFARMRSLEDTDDIGRESFVVATCLLEPTVTVEEARELLEGKSYGATQRLIDRIVEVSGLGDGFREGEAD